MEELKAVLVETCNIASIYYAMYLSETQFEMDDELKTQFAKLSKSLSDFSQEHPIIGDHNVNIYYKDFKDSLIPIIDHLINEPDGQSSFEFHFVQAIMYMNALLGVLSRV